MAGKENQINPLNNRPGLTGDSPRGNFIKHNLSFGQPVGGPFRTRQEVEGLTSELARFDWNRAIEEFSDEEIRGSVRLANNDWAGLEFKYYPKP